jgi:hypothetical protein
MVIVVAIKTEKNQQPVSSITQPYEDLGSSHISTKIVF